MSQNLPGAVIMVPNRYWGFTNINSVDHPGVCVELLRDHRDGVLVKGTDAEHAYGRRGYLYFDPTPENGLKKETAFEMRPKVIRTHTLENFFPERYLGHVEESVRLSILEELARLFPVEG